MRSADAIMGAKKCVLWDEDIDEIMVSKDNLSDDSVLAIFQNYSSENSIDSGFEAENIKFLIFCAMYYFFEKKQQKNIRILLIYL